MSDYIDINCRKASCIEQELLLGSVARAAKSEAVDYLMLLAIVRVESAFDVRAKNGSNTGLMQIHLKAHRKRFVGKNPFDVGDNILAGAEIYRACLDRAKGNRTKALKCYNGGGDPGYVTKVNKAYQEVARLVDLQRE